MSNRIQSPSCRGCHAPRGGVPSQSSSARPCALLPPIPPGRWAGRGRLVLLVFICLFPRCYDNPPARASRATSSDPTEPVTGGVCRTSLWLGPLALAVVPCSRRGGAITHITLLKAQPVSVGLTQ